MALRRVISRVSKVPRPKLDMTRMMATKSVAAPQMPMPSSPSTGHIFLMTSTPRARPANTPKVSRIVFLAMVRLAFKITFF